MVGIVIYSVKVDWIYRVDMVVGVESDLDSFEYWIWTIGIRFYCKIMGNL